MEEKELLKVKKIIKKYLREHKLTYDKFSKKNEFSEFSENTVKTYISGRKFISKKFLVKFSELKDLPIEDKKIIKNLIKKSTKDSSNLNNRILIDHELSKKIDQLKQIEQQIQIKKMEYEKLERTSGVRSKVVWSCIDIQKYTSSKIIELISIYNMANDKNQRECLPAINQLSIHLEEFSKQLKRTVNAKITEGEIYE